MSKNVHRKVLYLEKEKEKKRFGILKKNYEELRLIRSLPKRRHPILSQKNLFYV